MRVTNGRSIETLSQRAKIFERAVKVGLAFQAGRRPPEGLSNTRDGVVWQRDFFDHRLRNRHEEREKVDYILMNPVRRGLCERIEDWPWIYRPADRLPPILGD